MQYKINNNVSSATLTEKNENTFFGGQISLMRKKIQFLTKIYNRHFQVGTFIHVLVNRYESRKMLVSPQMLDICAICLWHLCIILYAF